MSVPLLRDKAAIVGLGYFPYSRDSGVSTLTMALQAVAEALADAGLAKDQLDGVACHRTFESAPAVLVAESLGIEDLRFHLDLFGGGSVSASLVGSAAMAVASGTAQYVVCWRSFNARSEYRAGGTNRPAPDSIEMSYQAPLGYFTAAQRFAMVSRAYMEAYGVTAEDLGRIAINQRDNALQNERALLRTPLTMEEYLSSRWIAEPLRLYDCCLETDAAVALIVTTADRARHLAQHPVLIRAATTGSGQTLYSNRWADLTVAPAASMASRLFDLAGIGPSEIDVAELYDAFTPLVLLQLEAYGFCKRGEGKDFVASGCAALTGKLPVNTHGGHLSEGYIHGLNHVAEAVTQLRGRAGPRQVHGATVALSTGQPGYLAGSTSAVILRKDD